MRITNNMMITNMMRNLNRNMLQLDKRQMQVSTGKRIHKPSDDPIAISRSLKIRADISELEQYRKNADDSVSWLESTELAAINTGKAMQRLREITVQAANGVLTEEETRKIQEEVKEIKQQIINLGNTTYAGKYIFSGKNTDKPLFDHFGNYNIDQFDARNPNLIDHRIQYEVGVGELIEINTLGIDLFESYSNASDLTLSFPTRLGEEHATKLKLEGLEIGIEMTDEGDPEAEPPVPPTYKAILEIEGEENSPITITMGLDEDSNPIYLVDENGDQILDEDGNPIPENKEAFMNRVIGELKGAIDAIENPLHPLKNFNFTAQNLKEGRVVAGSEESDDNWTIKAQPKKAGLIHLIERIEGFMKEGKHEELNNQLGNIDKYMDSLLTTRSEIGAKVNRMELVQNRIADDKINFRNLQSQLEDADMGEVIMELMNEENVYRAALSVGARIIQPTLLDFLR
ncbi:flagellar hook-associated protein FlgL [Natronincola ferrireducens]|uniref:Flagellar hook-associated protein 3 FlgL n=1 Tax=Natronincola ferrireducens TaxID=393762 RepID=A0A1G8XL17_9FIRM|nr:flagellar hook-associated protein FlgL [Natronincola ferrireducens]SDJ91126.1 flagellar hook-associated protein 3 FlgL [Natronincola ferrireducens]